MTSRFKTGSFILAALSTAFILRSVFGHPTWIMTDAMVPTLAEGELVWVSQQTPRMGDAVKVRLDSESGIYRLVAAEGQQVEISGGVLQVDGATMQKGAAESMVTLATDCALQNMITAESTINDRTFVVVPGGNQPLVQIPKGRVYLLGDHRGAAGDSRQWGPIGVERVEGVVTRILWSWDSCETRPRWHRIGKSIE